MTFFEFAKKRAPAADRTALWRAAKEWESAESGLTGRKKLSQIRRGELRQQRQRAFAVLLTILTKSEEGQAAFLAAAARLRHAVGRAERADRELNELSARFGEHRNDLKVMFTSSTEPPARRRLSRRLNLPAEQLDVVEIELRRHFRALREAGEVLGTDREAISRLLTDLSAARRSDRRKVRSARAVRGNPSPVQTLVVEDAGPTRKRETTSAPRARVRPRLTVGRKAPLLVAVVEVDVGTVEIGAHGEALCFKDIVWPAWDRLINSNKTVALELITRIAAEYWTITPELTAVLERVRTTAETHGLGDDGYALIKALVWPASTTFGDAVGFDMLQPTASGQDWLCVEVKSTAGHADTPFLMTRNEWAVAQREGARYAIYRVSWVLAPDPVVNVMSGLSSLVESGELSLTPSQYVIAAA